MEPLPFTLATDGPTAPRRRRLVVGPVLVGLLVGASLPVAVLAEPDTGGGRATTRWHPPVRTLVPWEASGSAGSSPSRSPSAAHLALPAPAPGPVGDEAAPLPQPLNVASQPPTGSVTPMPTDPSPPTPPEDSRPNVVLVLTDDLTADLLAFMPHVRDMVRRGVSFDRFFVTQPLCCPSRASALTGRYPHSTGVVENGGPQGGYRAFHGSGEERHTFATALNEAGYHTALVGKYLNQYRTGRREMSPIPPGWDEWYVTGKGATNQYGYNVNANGQLRRYGHRGRLDNSNHVITRHAADFITRAAAGRAPFMLEIAPFAPHAPAVPAVRHTDDFPLLLAPRSPAFNRPVAHGLPWTDRLGPISPPEQSEYNARYRYRAQSAATLDDMVAALQRVLARTGEASNTYVFFTSDNGYHLGEHRLQPGKRTAFETDVRVPLVVTGPDVREGAHVGELTSMLDLAPTFLRIAGLHPTSRMEGRSLLGWLHGSPPAAWRRALLVEYLTARAPNKGAPPFQALRTERTMWVAYPRSGRREYYDVARDPAQLVNAVRTLSPSRRAALDRRLAALAGCHARDCLTADGGP